jgi:hypothetical protein
MGLTASIASAVLAAVDTPTGRGGRVSNSFVTVEGEGVGVLDDGSISYDEGATGDIIVTARPGWRVNGQKSVTLNPARGSRQPLGATSDLHEDQEHIHFFPRSESDEHVPDSHMEVFAEANPASAITMYALPDTSTVVTVSANVYLMRSALHRKVAKYGKCWCGQARDPEIEYGLPYAVKPDRYEWTASGAGLSFHDSTWTGEMSKGLAQKIEFTVKAKRSSCTECDCEANAEATVDVHELSIERPDYVGLDMTDAKRGEYVYKSATAKIDPAPAVAEYEWQKCGRCEFYGATNKGGVTYRANDETGPSGSYLEEELIVKATARNKDGLYAEATCKTNFTVVAVDATINGVGEDKEETEGAFVHYVADANGAISVDGTNKLVGVSFTCKPKLPPEEIVKITCDGPGELYEALENGELLRITSADYPACEIGSHKFRLHGHSISSLQGQGELMITHLKSGAVDAAKFTTFGVEILTYASAPNNVDSHRTVLGVGEKVVITTYPKADILSCGNGKLTQISGSSSKYEAPHVAGSDVVVADFERLGQCSVEFAILEPSGYIINEYESDRYPLGDAGAGMKVVLQMRPLEVSLGEVEFKEIGKISTDARGYFAKPQFARHLVHNASGWKGVGNDNAMGTDHAFADFLPKPWESGSFSWDIPACWRVCGDEIEGNQFEWSNQVFTIDSFGTVGVMKFGLCVKREVTQNYGLITSEGE